jgi:hypothetical protein
LLCLCTVVPDYLPPCITCGTWTFCCSVQHRAAGALRRWYPGMRYTFSTPSYYTHPSWCGTRAWNVSGRTTPGVGLTTYWNLLLWTVWRDGLAFVRCLPTTPRAPFHLLNVLVLRF